MNHIKKITVNFRKPRGVYDEINKVYRQKNKYDPNRKSEIRMERRMKQLGVYDFDETEESPIEHLTANRAKTLVKVITDYRNNNRLSRPQMPKEVKEEYVKRCKEFSLWASHKWRTEILHKKQSIDNYTNMCMAASSLLPVDLAMEVIDLQGAHDPLLNRKTVEGKPEDVSEGNEINEYHPNFLYAPQLLRVYPDDLVITKKVQLNIKAYFEEGRKTGDVASGDGSQTSPTASVNAEF
jgi:hypothetical protein